MFSVMTEPENCLSVDDAINAFNPRSPRRSQWNRLNFWNIHVSELQLDHCSNSLRVLTHPWKNFSLIPDKVTLQDSLMDATFHWQPLKITAFTIGATWKIGSITLALTFSKLPNGYEMSANAEDIRLNVISNHFGSSVIPSGTGIENALNSFGLQSISLNAVGILARLEDDSYTFVFSGKPQINDWKEFEMFVMVHKVSSKSAPSVVISVAFHGFKVQTLLKSLTGLDVVGIPILQDMQVPDFGLIISTAEETLPWQITDSLIIKGVMYVGKGLTIVLKIPIGKGSSNATMALSFTTSLIGMYVIPPDTVTIREGLLAFFPMINLNLIDNLRNFPPVLDIGINSITYDRKTKTFLFSASLTKDVDLIHDVLELRKPRVYFMRSPEGIFFSFHADWKVAGSVIIQTYFEVNKQDFTVSGSVDWIPLGSIVDHFKVRSEYLPNVGNVKTGLQNSAFDDFGIKGLTLSIIKTSGNLVFSFGGKVQFSQWGSAEFQCVVAKTSTVGIAFGLSFDGLVLHQLIKKITGHDLTGLSLLDNLKVSLAVSSADLPNFKSGPLRYLQLQKGAGIAANFKFPTNCGNDQFCTVAKNLLGADTEFMLSAWLRTDGFELSAGIPTKISLGKGYFLSRVALVFITTPLSVKIRGSLTIPDPPLIFTGAIGLTEGGVMLAMAMQGTWDKPFGISFLRIGTLTLGVTFMPEPDAFNFGGALEIGHLGTRDVIRASAYIGVDAIEPRNNYFYASINKFTVQSLCNAFQVNVNLPRAVGESGFPEGVLASASLKEQRITGLDIIIPQGFVLKGKLVVLGWKAECDIKIDTDEIYINALMDPVRLGGVVALQRSPTQSNIGPLFHVNITFVPVNVDVLISGYIYILGFSRYIDIEISDEKLHIEFDQNLWNIFDTNFIVDASYGSISTASFHIKASVQLGLKQVSDYLKLTFFVRSFIKINSLDTKSSIYIYINNVCTNTMVEVAFCVISTSL